MPDFTLAQYNDNLINLTIVPCEEFELNKGTYTVKWTITFGSLSQTLEYELTTANPIIATRVLNRFGGNTCLSYFWIVSAPTLKASVYPKLFEGNYSAITQATLIDNTGDSIVTPGTNFEWYGFRGTWEPSGTVSDCNPNIEIEADFPIFLTETTEDASITQPYQVGSYWNSTQYVNDYTYCNEIFNSDYTNIDKAANYMNIANTIPHNKVWSIQNYFKVNGTISTTKAYSFRILPTAKIGMYVTDQIEGDSTPNAHIVISDYPCLVKPYSAPDNAYTQSNSIDADYWWGEWLDADQSISYYGYGSTNIPIFRSSDDLQKYFDGELTIDDAINGGDTTIKTSTIGDELTSSSIPTINMSSSGVGVYVYALTEAEIKDIMGNYLYTTDPNTQATIEDALWLWGNNPIDFLIDCYYIPFDISSFYTTITANLKFGTYQFTGTSFPVVKETTGNRLTLFNTTFEGVYGDWRDYTQFTYELYLPFYGFINLDVYKYLNHVVKCEMMFDLTTHNVRYYLYVDGIITDRVDASVGINIPLMATDMVNKAKHDRDTRYGVLTDSISAGTSIGMGVTSADIGGGITGVIGGVSHIISGVKKYQELNTHASQGVHGSFSSSMNVYDVMYAYVKITEQQTILPSNVNTLYNYPSYYMGPTSQLNGYCELSDIRFTNFTGTETEQIALKSELMGGVIL